MSSKTNKSKDQEEVKRITIDVKNDLTGEEEERLTAIVESKHSLLCSALEAKELPKSFLDILEAMPEQLTRFNGKDFLDTVDRVEVGQHILTYHFYGGEYIKVNIQLLKTMCI